MSFDNIQVNQSQRDLLDLVNGTVTKITSKMGDDGPIISIDNLYPALVECFGIIICGYLAGRLQIISSSESKGLNTFVGNFALPSLIFISLVELDWSTVNWTFLWANLVAKSIVFVAVIVITLLITRPLNWGRAGILATFCTQSNDFAIGYPIVVALYKNVHPEYASYLYLMAPISLAILNPIGYVLMEISKIKNAALVEAEGVRANLLASGCPQMEPPPSNRSSNSILILKVLRAVFVNPILIMTVLGVAGGFAFPHGLPDVISMILKSFGNSFSATGLFLLGLRMVGKARVLQGSGFLIPGVLILVKLLVYPLVTRQTVNVMNAGVNFTDTTDLSTFGFLYGTFPTAPGVFVIAAQYQTDVDLVASTMVACTFISGPLMFISAKMISLTNLNPADYLHELDSFAFDISIVSIFACCWILILFGFTNKFKRMPHRITCCLVISQLINVIGIIFWSTLGNKPGWSMYIQFALFTIGSYSSRLWAAILAVTLLFLQCRSLCFVLKLWPLFISVAWGLPTLLVTALLIIDRSNITPSDKRNPSFQYGNAQAAITVFLLVMCFIVTVGCLVLHQRYKKRIEKYRSLSKDVATQQPNQTDENFESTENLVASDDNETDAPLTNVNVNFSINNRVHTPNCTSNCCASIKQSSNRPVVDIEDLIRSQLVDDDDGLGPTASGLCSSQFRCGTASRQNCQNLVHQYQADTNQDLLEPLEYSEDNDSGQTMRHIVLLILLLCSMFVGLALSIWTLVMEGMSGVYVELSFLDAFLNFGQSLIVLACFITDSGDLLMPMLKYWRKIWYGANILKLPDWNSLSDETKHTCDQFVTYHLENCRKAIASDKRWRIKVYKKVFYGNVFVDWLIEVGLANDRIQAIHYATLLINGRVLRHINDVHQFYDKNFLYTFCSRF